jgi:plastocyanin
MLRRSAALLLIAALSVAACGGGSSGSSATTAPATPTGGRDYPADTPGPSTIVVTPAPPAASPAPTAATGAASEVAIAGFAFAPADLTVAAGTTVTWTNSDSAGHTVKSTDGGFASSGTLKKGDSYSITFDKAGTFPYVCAIHSSMTGTITVTP